QQRGVVRTATQASGDRQDSRHYAALTAETLISSLTSLDTSRPPLGSVWFHLRSKSRRSITVSSSKPMRSLPHGSVPPSATWPASSIGFVIPLRGVSPVARRVAE